MTTVQDLCLLVESFAPLRFQESYDNSGLIVGDRQAEVSGVLIALDVTEAVLDEAIGLGYNFILTHHPLIFKGIRTITGKGHTETCLLKAIRNHLNIYAGHTNVDSVWGGVNDKMANKLELKNLRILQKVSETDEHGLGMIGELSHPITEDAFLHLVKSTFGCKRIRHSALTGLKIKTVAVCGGSGSDLLELAERSGADVLVTGEAKYHEFFTEGRDILLVDAGHYETEQFTKEVFFDLISKNLPTFAVRISEAENNPVLYI